MQGTLLHTEYTKVYFLTTIFLCTLYKILYEKFYFYFTQYLKTESLLIHEKDILSIMSKKTFFLT
jgi:hypothetical protein